MGDITQVRTSADAGAPQHDDERLERLLRRWWLEDRPAWTVPSWWDAPLREDARRLLWLEPGPALVQALAMRAEEVPFDRPCPHDHAHERLLARPVPGSAPGWPCACQVVTAAAWDACASWVAARAAGALVGAAGPEPVEVLVGAGRRQVVDPCREELAVALRTSIPSMANRIGAARALVASPGLVRLVEQGAISAWAGRLVSEQLTDLTGEQAEGVVREVASRVRERLGTGRRPYHSGEVNRLARAARLRVSPDTAQQCRARAFEGRRVMLHRRADGMATLVADLADVDALRIHRRLTALAAGIEADAAATGASDTRTRDQVRADVLRDLVLGTPHGEPVGPAGNGVEIQVLVTLPTLLGMAADPAQVPGLGPVPAEVARELAADGRWRAWVADARGAVTATGSAGYVPGAALARLIRARHQRCRFPGCHQPSARCDLDHAVPWPAGGTTLANLGPLCRRHHGFKTDGAWILDTEESDTGDGAWQWSTPAGLTVRDGPEPPLPSG